jgi:lysophospholipase L1-like esterase
MSSPGFYSDIYQQIRTYADLVDKVLIALKGDARSSDPNRENLAQILDAFAEDEQEDLSIRIIVIMLGGNSKTNREKWLGLSAALRAAKSDRSLIDDLELFAHTLEQQQADALAKMRGWYH